MCMYCSGFVGKTEEHHPLMVVNNDSFYVLGCIYSTVLLMT